MPEVGDASARFGLSLLARTKCQGDWQDLTLYSRPGLDDLRINKVHAEAGAWPPPKDSIVLERNSLPLLGVQLGDTVQVDLGDNRLRDVQVAGVVHDINLPPARFAGRTFGYVSFDTLEHWGYPRQFNELLLTVASQQDSKAHIKAVVDEVKDKIEKAGQRHSPCAFRTRARRRCRNSGRAFLILGILGGLSLLLSGFLVVNTINATLAQQTRQVGVMKAIGARTDQIVGLYLGMALIYGLLALLVAIPLGSVGAYALSRFAAGFLNFDVVNHGIPPECCVAGRGRHAVAAGGRGRADPERREDHRPRGDRSTAWAKAALAVGRSTTCSWRCSALSPSSAGPWCSRCATPSAARRVWR